MNVFDSLRTKYGALAASQRRELLIRAAVRDSIAQSRGLPSAVALAPSVALGRFWFSLWDAQHAPFCRRQRFEA